MQNLNVQSSYCQASPPDASAFCLPDQREGPKRKQRHWTTRLRVRDHRNDFPVFIHSELDDYGLTPIEFRIYARLARRAGQHGKHSESIPNMAREFEVSIRTIQYTLKVLVACRLITRHPRAGKTDEYSLNPRSVWRNKSELAAVRVQVKPSGATRARGVVQPERGVVVQPEIDEGTPPEGTPLEGTPRLGSSGSEIDPILLASSKIGGGENKRKQTDSSLSDVNFINVSRIPIETTALSRWFPKFPKAVKVVRMPRPGSTFCDDS